MAGRMRYPVGMQSFRQIREGGFVYVDKTAYVHAMATRGGNFYFLSRPRRFGKSLLVSTLEAYFQGRRDLFEGLALAELEPDEWPEHPVLRLDLSQFKATDRAQLDQCFDDLFRPLEERWGVEPRAFPGSRLEALVRAAHRSTGREVVVLVDEYDAPLLTVMHDPERLQEFREVMRGFYAPLKGLSELLRFVFLTGVSRFSQLSVFSELNNLQNVSMLPAYAGVCGVTEEELTGALAPGVADLACRLGVAAEEALALLKARYDGYHFSRESPDVYNPFSLLFALSTGELGDYWFSSGTPTALVQMVKRAPCSLQELDRGEVEAKASSFDAPTEGMVSAVPFMYQSGYLTIKGYDPLFNLYRLGIPNQEVRTGLFEALLPSYSGEAPEAGDALVTNLARSVMAGDLERFFELLRAFFAGMHGRVCVRDERDFQQVLYVVLVLLGAYVECEVSTARGRADFVLQTKDAVYAVELKFSRSERPATAGQALAQVLEKGYLEPYAASGRRLVAAGAVFDEERGTLGDVLVEEQG